MTLVHTKYRILVERYIGQDFSQMVLGSSRSGSSFVLVRHSQHSFCTCAGSTYTSSRLVHQGEPEENRNQLSLSLFFYKDTAELSQSESLSLQILRFPKREEIMAPPWGGGVRHT